MWHDDDAIRGGTALMWHIGDMAMGDVALCGTWRTWHHVAHG